MGNCFECVHRLDIPVRNACRLLHIYYELMRKLHKIVVNEEFCSLNIAPFGLQEESLYT